MNEDIIVYKIDKLYDGLKVYVEEIKDNIEKGDDVLKGICDKINKHIRSLFNENIFQTKRQIQLIANGSSSSCYRSLDNRNNHPFIYKVFSPLSFCCNIFYEKASDVKDRFCLIPDCAEPKFREDFLRRFVRFIGQKEEIELCRTEADEDPFQSPILYFSSMGFVYEIDLRNKSETLEEKFRGFVPNNEEAPTLKKFNEVIKLVCDTAKNISKFCHHLGEDESNDNSSNITLNRIFHGDIKPENFLVIYTLKSENNYFIRNIDFDTWVSEKKIKEGYLKNFGATTSLYYDIDSNHTSNNQSFEDWCNYDVQALGRVLMYALALLTGFDVQKTKFDWEKFFFKPQTFVKCISKEECCPAKRIFQILDADRSLARLLIFEQLKELLLWCESSGSRDVKVFISKLSNIEQLLNGTKPEDESLFLRYLNLKYLDSEISHKSPFAMQCFKDFIVDIKDKDGLLNLNYDKFIEIKSRQDDKVDLLYTDFVTQVLDKAFKAATDEN